MYLIFTIELSLTTYMQTETDRQTGRQTSKHANTEQTDRSQMQTDRLKISDVKYSGVSDQN